MEVIILAGGFGSRLDPWTSNVPKPLLPMLDKTLVERVLDLLPTENISRVIIAAGYKAENIKEYFSNLDLPYEVIVQPEKNPLGTGGAIANCRELITDTFLVINGDLITSVNLNDLVKRHRESGLLATISLFEVDDPTPFGVVELSDDSKIIQFQEKPAIEDALSNLINAGTYVLEPDIFEIMPDGRHSMERDVFTIIAPRGELLGVEFEGYFVDAGTPKSWLKSCKTCFEDNRWKEGINHNNNWLGLKSDIIDSDLKSSFISKNCRIFKSRIVGSCILSNTNIDSGTLVENSLVGENVKIGKNCNIKDVIVDFNSVIPDGWKQSGGKFSSQ